MLMNRSQGFGARRAQRGLSLVELMVGITIGLIVVAAAATITAAQLSDNRRLLIETQLQQDLRASMDIITRELRRTGSEREAVALLGLWYPQSDGAQRNAFAESPSASASGVPVSNFQFAYQPRTPPDGPFGFKLEGEVVKTLLAGGGWQELTDNNVMKVTAFTITPQIGGAVRLPCPRLCADGTDACWPQVTVRRYDVSMTAQARTDPNVVRSISSSVRLRNDYVRFDPALTQICPT